MDADLYKEAIDYELLTKSIYEEILKKDGVSNIDVQHNIQIKGRSSVDHQVDVYWEFRQAGLTHKVIIECKNYQSSLTLEKVRNFFAVMHDIGNCMGIMVTKTGYQSGAALFAKHYGVSLKLLRKPNEGDWKGRVQKVHLKITARAPISTEAHPIKCDLYVRPNSDDQEKRLQVAQLSNPALFASSPFLQFLDINGEILTEPMMYWLPRNIDVFNYKDGGPHEKRIALTGHFLHVETQAGKELVQIIGVVVVFFAETLESNEVIIDAADTVEAILKDFQSGNVEHVKRKGKGEGPASA